MKKVILSVAALGLMLMSANAQVSYGLKAGLNLGKYSGDFMQEVNGKQKMHPSFYVTGFADIPVAPQFSIQPGVSLQGKGTKVEAKDETIDGSLTANVMSIEIPVNAVYYMPAGSGNAFIGAGPYVGFNISGTLKGKGTVNGEPAEENIDLSFSGDDKSMERLDAGVNFLLGYKMNNGFLINAGYNLGLTNLSVVDETKSSNRVLSFGVGFQF